MSRDDMYDSAAALYDGGWRAKDKLQLMSEYDLTDSEAESICDIIATFEEECTD